MDNMERVLKGLLKRTEEGKLKWRTTVDENRFLASVDTIAVAVQRVGPGVKMGSDRFKFEVVNDEGITVESLESQDKYGLVPSERGATTEQEKDIDRLFTLARRSALDSDATLEKLANTLENFQ